MIAGRLPGRRLRKKLRKLKKGEIERIKPVQKTCNNGF